MAAKIIREPHLAPTLAESLPKASNFYLTYFLIQGLTSATSNVLNSSDLAEYLFYQYFWDKTPREKFTSYSQMKGISYGSLFPKFTNLLVIAIAYSCIAPLTLAFATIGLAIYYTSYRYNLLYVCLSKIDTRGQVYVRALKQIPTGIYLAELALIGLFSARKAVAQTVTMVVLLVLTAGLNLVLDRTLRPLELYLGLDELQAAEVPLLAEEDSVSPDDEVALHMSAHNRRLGVNKLGTGPATALSRFFDQFITSARDEVEGWLSILTVRTTPQLPAKKSWQTPTIIQSSLLRRLNCGCLVTKPVCRETRSRRTRKQVSRPLTMLRRLTRMASCGTTSISRTCRSGRSRKVFDSSWRANVNQTVPFDYETNSRFAHVSFFSGLS